MVILPTLDCMGLEAIKYNKEKIERLKQLCIGKPVYCLFNNSYMYQNVVEFENVMIFQVSQMLSEHISG